MWLSHPPLAVFLSQQKVQTEKPAQLLQAAMQKTIFTTMKYMGCLYPSESELAFLRKLSDVSGHHYHKR